MACRPVVEVGLGAGARVDQAAGILVFEGVVQAGLVAGDAGIDLVASAGSRLRDPGRIGEQRPRHRHHVGLAGREHVLGDLGHVDAVGRDHRHRHQGAELGGDSGEGRTRYRSCDRWNPGLVPADAGVDDRRAGGLDGLGLHDDLVPARAVRHELGHRQAIDDDEVLADRFPDAPDDFHREAHALLGRAAPGVAAPVGAGRQELIDQVALGAHDLDAVIAGLARQARAIDEGLDLALDAPTAEAARLEGIDRRLDRRRRHRQRVVAVAPGMQDLQADPAPGLVHGLGDDAVLVDFPGPAELAGEGFQPADQVRADATGDHEPDTAFGALAEVRGQFREIPAPVFQAGMHRTHQDPVGQGAEPEVQRREQVRVGRRGHGGIRWRRAGRNHARLPASKQAASGGLRQAAAARHPYPVRFWQNKRLSRRLPRPP